MPSRIERLRSRTDNSRRSPRIGAGLAAAAMGAGLLTAAGPAAAETTAETTPNTLLEQGSAGADVSEVQRALHIAATGHFDRRTVRAVLSFQRRDGLLIDGIVGPQTWGALFESATARRSSSSTAGTPGASSSSSTGSYTIPASIVQCESAGNYSAVNPQSGAGGAYQILPSTWQAYGGQGAPQDAPKAEQDRIAAQIYASQGASAWSC